MRTDMRVLLQARALDVGTTLSNTCLDVRSMPAHSQSIDVTKVRALAGAPVLARALSLSLSLMLELCVCTSPGMLQHANVLT